MRRFRLVTGPRGSGKTKWFLGNCAGMKGLRTVSTDASKEELFLVRLETGEKRPLMRRPDGGGPYIVDEDTFRWANSVLTGITGGDVAIDECGWMELEGRGFRPALDVLISNPEIRLTLAVRDLFLPGYLELLGKDNCEIIQV